MLSRVAENLFWMSRYLERAENVARLLDIGLYLELDAPSTGVEDGSAPTEIALEILSCAETFGSMANGSGRKTALEFLTFDRANPQSIVSIIALCAGKRAWNPGKPRRRRLERGQSPVPLPVRRASAAPVSSRPVGVLLPDQAVVHTLRWLDPEHAAAR